MEYRCQAVGSTTPDPIRNRRRERPSTIRREAPSRQRPNLLPFTGCQRIGLGGGGQSRGPVAVSVAVIGGACVGRVDGVVYLDDRSGVERLRVSLRRSGGLADP